MKKASSLVVKPLKTESEKTKADSHNKSIIDSAIRSKTNVPASDLEEPSAAEQPVAAPI